MIDHGINESQLLHFVLFIGAMYSIKRLPAWLFCAVAAVLIEFDQAREYAPQFWQWFTLLDTWADLAADALAIGLMFWIERKNGL